MLKLDGRTSLPPISRKCVRLPVTVDGKRGSEDSDPRAPSRPADVPTAAPPDPSPLAGRLRAQARELVALADAIDGGRTIVSPGAEWSVSMTRGFIAGCLGLSRRELAAWERGGRIQLDEINRQRFRVRLDALDAATRRAFD